MHTQVSELKLALLIDADNISYKYLETMFAEIAKCGTAYVKRIYGDWSSPVLKPWKDESLKYSIVPIQQFSYTARKNSTDSAMIIDAMDILYAGNVDGFCLASSDSDFTRLASRLRESGKFVLGLGENKTPMPFRNACDKFVCLDLIQNLSAKDGHETENSGQDSRKSEFTLKPQPIKVPDEVVALLRMVVNENCDEEGWVWLGTLGAVIYRYKPDFDFRIYGYRSLSAFFKSLDEFFEIDVRLSNTGSNIQYPYIRCK